MGGYIKEEKCMYEQEGFERALGLYYNDCGNPGIAVINTYRGPTEYIMMGFKYSDQMYELADELIKLADKYHEDTGR
jgi:hypothetical protein